MAEIEQGLTEYWQAEKEDFKNRCEKRNNIYEPELIKIGAHKKSDAVYEYDGWFCYPTKGFAMEKKNTQNRIGLDSFIKKYLQSKTFTLDEIKEIINKTDYCKNCPFADYGCDECALDYILKVLLQEFEQKMEEN